MLHSTEISSTEKASVFPFLLACSPFDRNLTATECLSLSLPVPLRELKLDESAVLSPCVPPCRPVSLKENDYEQRRSQVRVLPSALLIPLQTGDFCCHSSLFRLALFVVAEFPRTPYTGSPVSGKNPSRNSLENRNRPYSEGSRAGISGLASSI